MSYFSLFQSPHPARGATRGEEAAADITDNFNPRTPRGVRPMSARCSGVRLGFQSTHPARGATSDGAEVLRSMQQFQSTHPARGATGSITGALQGIADFNPRTPRGVRLMYTVMHTLDDGISIHAPREGCDPAARPRCRLTDNFNPRTPRGVRPYRPTFCELPGHFNPRTPRGVRRALAA